MRDVVDYSQALLTLRRMPFVSIEVKTAILSDLFYIDPYVIMLDLREEEARPEWEG